VPVVKRRKHAQAEEDETYEQEVSPSEEEYDPEDEEVYEEEEEEVELESDTSSDIEEELPSTSKTLKENAMEMKKKILKRKMAPEKQEKKRQVVKKVRVAAAAPSSPAAATTAAASGSEKRIVRKVLKKPAAKEKQDDGKKTTQGGATLPVIEYNDKNVDYNLYNEAPENIKNVKIKISSNLVMLCRMIEATGTTAQSLNYDYAALSFVRQSKNGRAYEYNVQLSSAPAIMKGISLIMKQNPKFFDKNFQSIPREENENE
jgi:hypothetical protein